MNADENHLNKEQQPEWNQGGPETGKYLGLGNPQRNIGEFCANTP
jgi:hypothetical protein